MKSIRVLAFACAVVMAPTAVHAQDFRLQIEVSRGATQIAKALLRVKAAGEGTLVLNSEDAPNVPVLKGLRERILLIPTLQGEHASIAFDITSGDKTFRPILLISRDLKGALEWMAADGQTIRLSVSWLPNN